MQYLNETNFTQSIASWVALVDFYADWCGPCQILWKLMPHLAEKYDGKALVAKVNTDTEFAITQRYQVSALPTVVVFKDWKEVERMRWLQPPEAYSAVIDKRLAA